MRCTWPTAASACFLATSLGRSLSPMRNMPAPTARDLHSSNFRLHVSTLGGTRWVVSVVFKKKRLRIGWEVDERKPLPTAPEDTSTTRTPLLCSRATVSHSAHICQQGLPDAARHVTDTHFEPSSLECSWHPMTWSSRATSMRPVAHNAIGKVVLTLVS
jgi:hypothetical protein